MINKIQDAYFTTILYCTAQPKNEGRLIIILCFKKSILIKFSERIFWKNKVIITTIAK